MEKPSKFISFLSSILTPVRKQWKLFIFIYLTTFLEACFKECFGIHMDLFLVAFCPILDCYLFCLLATLGGRFAKAAIYVLASLLFLFEIFLILNYNTAILPHIMTLIFQTNGRESIEFLTTIFSQASTWLALAFTALLVVLDGVLIPNGISNLLKKHPVHNLKRQTQAAILILSILLLTAASIREIKQYRRMYNVFRAESTMELQEPYCRVVLASPWIRLVYSIGFLHAESKEMPILEQSVENTVSEGCDFTSPLIMLIIGESYNKHHTPIYNPESLPTTPRLLERVKNNEIIPFTDVVTPSNSTAHVFKHLFSMGSLEEGDDWTRHTLFPALFKKSGYDVWFISNHYVRKDNGNHHDMTGGILFNYGNLEELQFTRRNTNTYTYDGDLIRELAVPELYDGKPKLVILHILGQHVSYYERYPESEKVFQTEDMKTAFGGEKGKKEAMDYANATLYNDKVIDSVLSLLDKTDGIAIYLSDHGEEVYDYRDFMLRSHEPVISKDVAKHQYEIPFLVYTSPEYRKSHNDLAVQIEEAKDKPFISSNLSHMLLYLGGIHCREYDESRNPLSPRYDSSAPRMLRGDTDYNALMKE